MRCAKVIQKEMYSPNAKDSRLETYWQNEKGFQRD